MSTEAWRFDSSKCSVEDRWSYSKFGDDWQNARVFGVVISRSGQKLNVKWDIDGKTIPFEIYCLFNENGKKHCLRHFTIPFLFHKVSNQSAYYLFLNNSTEYFKSYGNCF